MNEFDEESNSRPDIIPKKCTVRRYTDLKQKIEVLNYIQNNPGVSYAKVSKHFTIQLGRSLTRQSVHYIFKNKDKIEKMMKNLRKKNFKTKNKDVSDFETALCTEVIATFERCNLTRSRINKLAKKLQEMPYFRGIPCRSK